jgi:endo-1,4-beta-xylanase
MLEECPVRLTRIIAVGAVAAATLGLLGATPAVGHDPAAGPETQTLRALAQRHGLAVGTAVDMAALDNSADPQYRALVGEQFSTVTPENVMKWESVEPTRGSYNWGPADELVAFAQAHHQQWHNQLPAWLTAGVADGSITDAQLRDLLHKHITDEVTHFRGKIWQWDVVNEAASDPWDSPSTIHYKGFWAQHLGPDYIADAFRWARAADPNALLFYNDYNIESFGDRGTSDKAQFVYAMVKQLRTSGVPIDGVGAQGHLGTQYGNFDQFSVRQTLDAFTDLGLATAFTEVDVRSQMTAGVQAGDSNEINPRLQAMAADYSVLLQACLANRHCLSYTVWGFTDKDSWVPGAFNNPAEGMATLYDENYHPKLAYQMVKADLAYLGAPLVLPRIPQRPKR